MPKTREDVCEITLDSFNSRKPPKKTKPKMPLHDGDIDPKTVFKETLTAPLGDAKMKKRGRARSRTREEEKEREEEEETPAPPPPKRNTKKRFDQLSAEAEKLKNTQDRWFYHLGNDDYAEWDGFMWCFDKIKFYIDFLQPRVEAREFCMKCLEASKLGPKHRPTRTDSIIKSIKPLSFYASEEYRRIQMEGNMFYVEKGPDCRVFLGSDDAEAKAAMCPYCARCTKPWLLLHKKDCNQTDCKCGARCRCGNFHLYRDYWQSSLENVEKEFEAAGSVGVKEEFLMKKWEEQGDVPFCNICSCTCDGDKTRQEMNLQHRKQYAERLYKQGFESFVDAHIKSFVDDTELAYKNACIKLCKTEDGDTYKDYDSIPDAKKQEFKALYPKNLFCDVFWKDEPKSGFSKLLQEYLKAWKQHPDVQKHIRGYDF